MKGFQASRKCNALQVFIKFASMLRQKVYFQDLGTMDYQSAWDYQEELLAKNVEAKAAMRRSQAEDADVATDTAIQTIHHLLFVEHPPVYTLGKSGKMEHVLISEEERQKNQL